MTELEKQKQLWFAISENLGLRELYQFLGLVIKLLATHLILKLFLRFDWTIYTAQALDTVDECVAAASIFVFLILSLYDYFLARTKRYREES